MTCIVILETTAKPGTGADLLEIFRAILPDTRNKDGCESVEVTDIQDNADHILLVERWASRAQYEAYLTWRQERGDIDTLVAALAEPPLIRYFDPTTA